MAAHPDIIDTMEAIYDLDTTEHVWLERICATAAKWYDLGKGTMAWTFSIRPDAAHLGEPVVVNGDPAYRTLPLRYAAAFDTSDTFRAYGAGPTISGQEAFPGGAFSELCPAGVTDFLATLGFSPDGLGVMLGAPSGTRIERISPRIQYWTERLAAHLANSYRLRRRLAEGLLGGLGPDDADAVLDPEGALVDAANPEAREKSSREFLRGAVKSIDKAKTRRGSDANGALDAWNALVDGRWSMLDHFESDGRRYIVALKNPPNLIDPRALSDRERQVAAYAALGHSGKQTAYAIGSHPSAVSRHLASALRKLGLDSTAELPAFFARLVREESAGGPSS